MIYFRFILSSNILTKMARWNLFQLHSKSTPQDPKDRRLSDLGDIFVWFYEKKEEALFIIGPCTT